MKYMRSVSHDNFSTLKIVWMAPFKNLAFLLETILSTTLIHQNWGTFFREVKPNMEVD